MFRYREPGSRYSFIGAGSAETTLDRGHDADPPRLPQSNRGAAFLSVRILITRPADDSGPFAAALEAAGFAPIFAPVLEIVLKPRMVSFDGVGAVAFTSANGVRALAAAAAIPPDIVAFAVGAASAAEARRVGLSTVVEAGGDLASLVEAIARRKFAGAVLHPCGRDLAGDLAGMLFARGVDCRREPLYEAEAASVLPRAARAFLEAPRRGDVVSFFSPRTARIFVSLVESAGLAQPLSNVRAACLSEAVAEAAEPRRWKAVLRATVPTAASLVAAILDGAGQKRS